MTHTTSTGAEVCEVVIVCDSIRPEALGEKKYSNQDYWRKVEPPPLPLDSAIKDCENEYEEAVELHKIYGES
jgi:hypothetical protein